MLLLPLLPQPPPPLLLLLLQCQRARECEVNTGPAQRPVLQQPGAGGAGGAGAGAEAEEEVDPLDAFMAEIGQIEAKKTTDDKSAAGGSGAGAAAGAGGKGEGGGPPPAKRQRHLAERFEEEDHVAGEFGWSLLHGQETGDRQPWEMGGAAGGLIELLQQG